MNHLSIIPCSTSDFTGVSVVLAVAGCVHKCKGCWAKDRGGWKYTSGEEFTEGTYQYLISLLDKPYIDNLVIQGGDVLAPKNVQAGIELCKRIRKDLPDRNIVIFSGYTLEQIQDDTERKEILPYIDILIDGKYEKDLPSAQWRGSCNQRIIDVKKTLDQQIPVCYIN